MKKHLSILLSKECNCCTFVLTKGEVDLSDAMRIENRSYLKEELYKENK